VIDDDGGLVGLIEADMIDAAVRRGAVDLPISELCLPPEIFATTGMPVTELVRQMGIGGSIRCPVVADKDSLRLVGFVSPSDLLRARIRSLDDS
jgi:CBS domain-containing protein